MSQDAFRARQGPGARYDAPAAPAADLLLARRGAAYFARKLNELRDEELFAPSARAGWTRSRVIAAICYHARAQARLVQSARTGEAPPAAPDSDIALGAALPARALRSLWRHADVHLNVEWRDLPDAAWDAPLHGPGGRAITARDLPMIRARAVWAAALDLGNGARMADMPPALRTEAEA
jgi:maleylpyruvate isomerase